VLRRAELRLSRAQVAARARMTPRYLEYLERYPATPDAGILRQLAAALRTTPAALLGGGGQAPPAHARPAGRRRRERVPGDPLADARGGVPDAHLVR